MDFNTDCDCSRAKDPGMALGSSSGSYTSMALGGNACHSGLYGAGRAIDLGHQHGQRWWPRSWISVWPLVATWTTGINTDHSCERAMDPDMVLVHSLGLDVIVALAGITGHPDQHDPSDSAVPECQHVLR